MIPVELVGRKSVAHSANTAPSDGGMRFAFPPYVSRVIIVLLVAVALAGCGKKGAPVAPPGEPDTYPRVYPSE